ncbi:uncharacterized protein O8D03_008696 [Erethizon dorsatum]
MASGPKMLAPKCLIENVKEQLSVNQEAVQILGKISNPVVVVAIVGLYRSGKSYLMNRLAGQNSGFPLGSTVQSETKGIWMWCMPHPTKPNHTLVLLDTEGLGDVEKVDPKNDSWIFALAVLLSSTFVYNSTGTINQQALEQLHYVTELTELIRARSSSSSDGVQDSTEFVSFFPCFIWAVRDFTLELKLKGQPVTADQYLENALKLIPDQNPKAEIYNRPRECLRNFFPHRKCFVFDQPTNDKHNLLNIENVSEDQLDPNFQEQINSFYSYVCTHAKVKTLKEGIVVTGNRLGALVETYVKAINSGAVPCLENAVTTLAQRENAAAVQKAADHYSEQMAQRVRLPTDTLQELLDVHAACEKEAIAVFMERSFKDEDLEFQKKLVKIIQMKKEDFSLKNEKESDQYCQEKLNLLSKALMENISAGTFCVPGGYQIYMETRKKIEEDYCQVPRKGVKAAEVFQRFLQSQAAIEDSIMQSDIALTDGEKAMAAEKAKKEAAEKEQELLRQKVQEQEQNLAAQERTLREHIEQSEKKLKLEKENILREQKKIMDQQLKIQKDLLEEGHKKKSEAMNAEINHLRNRIKTMENNSGSSILRALTGLGTSILTIVCAPFTLLGAAIEDICSLFRQGAAICTPRQSVTICGPSSRESWLKTFPIHIEKIIEECKILLQEIIPRYGPPLITGNANGPAFVAEIVQNRQNYTTYKAQNSTKVKGTACNQLHQSLAKGPVTPVDTTTHTYNPGTETDRAAGEPCESGCQTIPGNCVTHTAETGEEAEEEEAVKESWEGSERSSMQLSFATLPLTLAALQPLPAYLFSRTARILEVTEHGGTGLTLQVGESSRRAAQLAPGCATAPGCCALNRGGHISCPASSGCSAPPQSDAKNDSWIFALAILLSSAFIYNSMSTINNDALEKLHYVTELIRARSSRSCEGVEDATEFISFFPDFLWTVLDFTLGLKVHGDLITEDEYLENALKLTRGDNPNLKSFNIPKECIRHFFPNQKCFVFDWPKYERELLPHIEDVLENQLDPKFQEQSKTFCSYIFTNARTKSLREGVEVTGNNPSVRTTQDVVNEVLQCFQKSQEEKENFILQADKMLTAEEEAAAGTGGRHSSQMGGHSTILDMAPENLMPQPLCLVENIAEKLVVKQEALRILSAITQPVVVVAIVGLYRTGKSYLMNKLAGKKKGFSVGSTVQAHTKGIWMWCVPHPEKPDHTLVLLDTEGLGDVEKVDDKNDAQVFALAILLSSTFVYNTMNKIDQGAIDLLHNVTELTDLLRARNSPDFNGAEDAADLVSFFPDLVWTLRDFYLQLETDGQLVTPDEYLENSLMVKEGSNEKIQHFNLPRLCIKKFFPRKKCFIFESPADRKKLSQLEMLHDDELQPEFVQQVAEFCSYIFGHSAAKTLPGGIKVNGPRLESLVQTYVNAINRGDLPCLENAVLALVQRENSAAVQKALAHYDQQMGQKVQLPTDTLQELLGLHRACEMEAMEIFTKSSFKDEDQSFQKELQTLLDAKHKDICEQNKEASSKHCSALLQNIFCPLEQDVTSGIYSRPGGHNLYLQKREELKAKYYREPRKGIQAEEELQKYLMSKQFVSAAILQTDQALTAKEKEREEAQRKAEAERAEAERLAAIARENQRIMEERERLHQQQVRQMEIERANFLAQQQREQQHRLQEEAERQKAMVEAELRRQQMELQLLQSMIHSGGHRRHGQCILQ